MVRLTIDDILALGPCEGYDRERVKRLFGRCRYATPERVAACESISVDDRLWLLVRMMPGDRERRLFACDCASRALRRERRAGREPDERSWAVVRVARGYARGKATDDELRAAWAAARAAAGEAAWAAARAAAWEAAGEAAREAARAAAWEEAREAARAAWQAAGEAEAKWQLRRAVRYCG
jgi:hypothetical protein